MLDQHQLRTFIQEYWTKQTFLVEIARESFGSLELELGNFDPQTLIGRHSGKVASVWFEDERGHFQAVDMPPADALKFYEAGMTVFLPDVNAPTVERWHAELVRHLAVPPRNVLTSLFVTKRGATSGCHFDHIENFTIQLRGTKIWKIAENHHAPRPTVNYSARSDRPYLEELWLYGERPFPNGLVADAQRLETKPGSLLYVPRGYWHEVEAISDSVSLLVGFPACTWIDLMLPALQTVLLRQAEWRENAIYPHDDESWRCARDRLAQLSAELASLLRDFDPADVLPQNFGGAPGVWSSTTVIRRNPLCTLGMYPDGEEQIELIARVHQGQLSRTREAKVPSDWGPALRSIDQDAPVTCAELLRRHPEQAEHAHVLLDTLVRLEAIRPCRQTVSSPEHANQEIVGESM